MGILATLGLTAAARAQDPGRTAYTTHCVRCHGKQGEGTKEYAHPLVGNRSLEQLTRYVARKMPEDAPGTLTPAESESVSRFIFDAFYSPEAQARIKAPRLELSRLTASEYRNALADVVGSVRPGKGTQTDSKPGLRGEYFTRDGKRNRTRVETKIEPTMKFDFADKSFARLDTPEIAAEWTGSILPPETGRYDFVVKTEHSTRLFVNDMKKPLIDAFVKSGDDVEFRGSIDLIGGRPYPIKLEFQRANIGVRKDPKEKLAKEKTTLSLEWKAPRRTLEVVPELYLRSYDASTVFTPTVALPADDRSAGYERGNTMSKAWVQATTDGAIEAAGYVAQNLASLSGVDVGNARRRDLLKEYCVQFAERAFRRPLSPEIKTLVVDRPFELAKDDETAVKRVVLLVLQSPRFLYREPGTAKGSADAFDVASRLSFALWDSIPDAALFQAAATGKLKTRDDVVREANRLLADPRARAKLRAFLLHWLKLDQVAEIPKDPKLFPDFDAAVVTDLQSSLDRFLDDVVWSDDSDFRRFFRGEHLYLNGRLASLYGYDLPADAPFRKMAAKSGERFGLLTHPYILANFSYAAESSPIHRGVFLARNIVGYNLRPPQDAFTPLPAESHPKLNTRERIMLQTGGKACQSCHGVINPLGFTLENYDAIGRFRDSDNGKPIDSSGGYVARSGETAKFAGVRDLAEFVAGSDEVHEAFVARLFHAYVKQPILAFGPTRLDDLRRRFADNRFHIRQTLIDIVADTALAGTGAK